MIRSEVSFEERRQLLDLPTCGLYLPVCVFLRLFQSIEPLIEAFARFRLPLVDLCELIESAIDTFPRFRLPLVGLCELIESAIDTFPRFRLPLVGLCELIEPAIDTFPCFCHSIEPFIDSFPQGVDAFAHPTDNAGQCNEPLTNRTHAVGQVPNLPLGLVVERSQAKQPLREAGKICLRLLRETGKICLALLREAGKICLELRLGLQQKLHRALDLLRRHRLEFHGNPSLSSGYRHYAIVPLLRRRARAVPKTAAVRGC
ncbi:MAG: hypothetical protein HYY76_17130 [Acidobacteria bacterium]|nr:hypothetical protein [Acidobacteriota bacterium]